jgi:CMP-N-acetylneuraminic acid synthetase
LNENTKFITFDTTNYGPLENFRISKQPLNISQEKCLWSNTEKTLKSFIDKYISDNIPTLYKTNDLRKIKNLEEAFKIFDKNEPTLKTSCLFLEHPYKETIICELITICTEFDNNPLIYHEYFGYFLKKIRFENIL